MNCLQDRQNCVFNSHGRCEILTDTYFNRACPFFKKAPQEVVEERQIAGHSGAFRSIKGYNGRYFVSEYGEVVSKFGNTIVIKANANGRLVVQLQRPSENWTSQAVAVLVADAFIGGTGEVEYIDGDPTNCTRWNLRRKG